MKAYKDIKPIILFLCAIIFLALFYISGMRNVMFAILDNIFSPVVLPITDLSFNDLNRDSAILKTENDKLRQENEELKDRLSLSQALIKDASSINQYKADKKIAAKILWFNLLPGSRIVHINKGSNDGVDKNMAVVSAGGILLGKTINVSNETADVLLIDDPSFKISVNIEGLTGLLTVSPNNKMNISMIGSDANLEPGVLVRTAGQGDFLPKNIVVGRVSEVSSEGAEPFLKIKVESLADINTQEYIFVIKVN